MEVVALHKCCEQGDQDYHSANQSLQKEPSPDMLRHYLPVTGDQNAKTISTYGDGRCGEARSLPRVPQVVVPEVEERRVVPERREDKAQDKTGPTKVGKRA